MQFEWFVATAVYQFCKIDIFYAKIFMIYDGSYPYST